MAESLDLTGRTAIVTGAGTGIGRATAERLFQAGASVVVNYFEDGEGTNRSAAEHVAEQLGDGATAIAGDVRDPEAVRQMFVRTSERFGAVHIVVNNAGILRDRTVAAMSDSEWRDVIDTNLTGVFNVSREAARRLEEGGRLISLASVSGVTGPYGQSNYVAAKAGVIGMTKVLSRELARRNITVNAVAPGLVDTPMVETIPEKYRKEMIDQIPLGRIAGTNEIAAVILFLCSSLASYVTGQTIHVNGGWWAP